MSDDGKNKKGGDFRKQCAISAIVSKNLHNNYLISNHKSTRCKYYDK